jgi:hypothetical protein
VHIRLPCHLRQNSSFIPHTFDALEECVGEHDRIVFQSMINWEGHHSTKSESYGESGMKTSSLQRLVTVVRIWISIDRASRLCNALPARIRAVCGA